MLDTTTRVDPASLFDNQPLCEQCGKPFEPRAKSGGSNQRFCSRSCRFAFHEAQRGPACSSVGPAWDQPAEKPAPAATTKDFNDDFDWSNDEDIVLREQQSIAIYRNKYEGIVIRQERRWNEDEDTVIVITRENIGTFVDKLCDAVGVQSFPAGGRE
jgi:hypothetical protein